MKRLCRKCGEVTTHVADPNCDFKTVAYLRCRQCELEEAIAKCQGYKRK